MKRTLLTTSILALMAASSASAEVSGFVAWSVEDYGGEGYRALSGDVTLSYQFSPLLGVEAGIWGFTDRGPGDDRTTERASFLALTINSAIGTFQVGAPRPVIDDYIRTPTPVSEYWDIYGYGGDTTSLAIDDLFSGNNSHYGARFDGTFAGVDVGLSFTRETEGTYDDYTQLVVRREFDNIGLVLGYEHESTESETALYLSIYGTWGPVGAVLFINDYSDDEDSDYDETLYSVGLSYDITDELTAGVSYFEISNEDDEAEYAIWTRYDFWQNAFVSAGYSNYSEIGEPDLKIWDLTIGWDLAY
jgi:predicted porin